MSTTETADRHKALRPALGRALVLSLSLTVGLTLGACSSSEKPGGKNTPSPTSTSSDSSPSSAPATPGSVAKEKGKKISPSDLPAKTVTAVEAGGKEYFEGWSDALSGAEEIDPLKTDSLPGLEGAALEELLNTVSEYQENGWRVEGRPTVLSTRVLSATRSPETVTVVACIDNSTVRLLDSKGEEVPNSRPSHPRTRNVLTLVPRGDGWVVGEQRPATRPNC